MRRRTRSLIGTIVMLAFIIVYAPLAMALADSRISQTHPAVQAVLYALLGIAWIFPLMPLISWMGRNDPQDGFDKDDLHQGPAPPR